MNNTPRSESNKPTRSASKAHEGQTAADTNPSSVKCEVTLLLTQWSSGRILIEAPTLEEARQAAEAIQMCDVDNWEVYKEAMRIESVTPITGGQDND